MEDKNTNSTIIQRKGTPGITPEGTVSAQFQIPARTSYRPDNMLLDKSAITVLMLCGNLTQAEFEDFNRGGYGELTMNEIMAVDLTKAAAVDKNPEAVRLWWDLQSKAFSKSNMVNQYNVAITAPDAMITKLLDDITDRITDKDTPK